MGFIVFLCFFLSGGSGLLFEVLWTRELGLIFGSTTLAMSTVLSVFMGGLALGSYLGGHVARRFTDPRRPLRAYALVEAGVGAYALLVPLILSRYPALNAVLWRNVGDHYGVLSLLRFLATALLLLFPTTLMGATLPLLSQYVSLRRRALQVHQHDRSESCSEELIGATTQIGALFALNTFGAVLGTFLSGFMLLPRLGVTMTNYVGAAVNLTLATIILLVERRLGTQAAALEPEPAAPTPEAPSPLAVSPRQRQLHRKIAVAAYAVSGATAMVYQVLWTRALAIVLGSSVYSFTLILLAFLIGLALGAAVMTRLLPGIRRPVLALGTVHALTLGTAVYSYLTLDQLPEVFLLILRGGSFNVDELLLTQFVLASLTMLPATLAMGAVMPLTMRIYTQSVDGAGKDVGVAYALNTLGAITGSFAAGFVVLPVLGLQRGLLLCAAITAGLAALLLWHAEPLRQAGSATNEDDADAEPAPPRRLLTARPLALVIVLATAGFVVLSPRWNLAHFSAGLFRISIAKSIFQLKNRLMPHLLYYKDGVATTVSVEQWDKTIALKNNGKVDASNGDDMATQILVGLMPLLFHPTALDKPPRVAVVGYGSGVTAGAVTQFPIGHADVIELEPAVVEAGDRYFADVSHLPSRDPRVKVIIGDGRNFMTQSDSKYDVIVSEPSNPWITGVSNLFTVDYWKLARSRLAEDGVFCQWAQLYELSQPNIKTLLRSFASVFPYTYVFAAEHLSSDVILVASHRPMPLDVRRLRRNFQDTKLRAELRRASVESAEEILADLLLTPDELWAFTAGATLNTDDNARIEFLAPRDLLGYMRHESSVPRVHSNEWLYGRFERYLIHQGLPFDQAPQWMAGERVDPIDVPRRADFYAELGRAMLAHGKKDAARRMYVHTLATGAGAKSDHLGQLLVLFAKRDPGEHEEPLSPGWDGLDDSFGKSIGPVLIPAGLSTEQANKIREQYQIAVRALIEKKWIIGLRALRDWPMAWIEQMGMDVRLVLGYLLYKADLVDNAVDHLEALLNDAGYIEQHPGSLYYLARSEFQNGEPRRAIAHMEAYLELRQKLEQPADKPAP